MRPLRFSLPAVLLLLVATAAPLYAKSNLNRLIVRARYVYVTSMNGDEFTAGVMASDREAIAAVQDALRKWGHYNVVLHPNQADLIFVVRTGRPASASAGQRIPGDGGRVPTSPGSVGVGIGTIPGAGIGVGRPGYGVEVGPSEDYLAIHDSIHGIDSSPLWRRTQPHGLGASYPVKIEPQLINTLREEVDKAEREDAAKQKKKP
jgi:hypothetical protein